MAADPIEADIAVVGAGIIGAACAFELARAGLQVLLLDARAPAAGTSGACDGYVSVSTKIPGLMMELAIASQRLYPDFAATLDLDVDYEKRAGLLLIEEESDVAAMESHVAALRGNGVRADFLDRQALRRAEPNLSHAMVGAVLCPNEAHVTPYRMNLALVDGAVRHGARTLWGAAVTAFDFTGRRISEMTTVRGRVRAERYLFCAGVWSQPLGEMVGLRLPVVPRRGALIVLQRSPPLVSRFAVSARYLTAKTDPESARRSDDPLVRLGYGFVMERTRAGHHIVGSTRTFSGHDRTTTTTDMAMILREAAKRVPKIERLEVLRGFAGLRPFVADKKPLIGASRRVDNLLIATGHEGDGVTMAPITGRLIRDLALGRTPDVDLTPMDPDRFTLH